MKKLTFIVLLATLFSCDKVTEINNVPVNSRVFLTLIDGDGKNILSGESTRNLNNLDLFYVNKSGQRIRQHFTNLDFPQNMDIVDLTPTDKAVLEVFANLEPQKDGFSESILAVKGYKEISIKLKVEEGSSKNNTSGVKGYSALVVNGENIDNNMFGKAVPVKLQK